MKKGFGFRFVLTTAAAILVQGAVRADSLGYTNVSIYSGVSPVASGFGGSDGHFSANKNYSVGTTLGPSFVNFSASLGHLDSVDWSITLSGQLASSFNYYSWFGSPGYGTASERLALQSIRLGSYSFPDKYLSTNAGAPSVNDFVSVPLFGSASGGLSWAFTTRSQLTDVSLLDSLINESSFYLDAQSLYSLSTAYATGGNGPPDFELQLAYTYNFTPVPEPSTVAIFVLGAIASWRLRLRKK